jgi:alkylated DNA nucleotide flippase Atl1
MPTASLTSVPQPIAPESFAELGVLEVQHIERWIAARPDILGEKLLVITTQFDGFDKTKERSDILALDVAGRVTVIELKRDTSGSRQDLQALRYAAYCATLTLDDLLDLYVAHHSKAAAVSREQARAAFEAHVVSGSLAGIDEDTRPRIVLLAKSFQIEVTATVLWLIESYGMDITCVELVPYKVGDQLLLSSSVRIPLPEASEYTVKRDAKRQKAASEGKIDWGKAMAVMADIPPGHWMSYQDLAVAAGGSARAGMPMGQYLARQENLPPGCVHRVLRSDGRISDGFDGEIGGPEAVRTLLESEGLTFDPAGRADPERRWSPDGAA